LGGGIIVDEYDADSVMNYCFSRERTTSVDFILSIAKCGGIWNFFRRRLVRSAGPDAG